MLTPVPGTAASAGHGLPRRYPGLKELILTLDWKRPLHVVVLVDEVQQEDRVVTVYEPETARWSTDSRRRR